MNRISGLSLGGTGSYRVCSMMDNACKVSVTLAAVVIHEHWQRVKCQTRPVKKFEGATWYDSDVLSEVLISYLNFSMV